MAADSNPLHAETKCEPFDVGKLRRKSASPQPTGRIGIVLILSGNSIRSSNSYAPACFATNICLSDLLHDPITRFEFLSMLLQSQTAPRRFPEPNKWAASRPISPVGIIVALGVLFDAIFGKG